MTLTLALATHEKIGLSCTRAGFEALSSIDLRGLSQPAVIELSRELEAVARRVPSVVALTEGPLRRVQRVAGGQVALVLHGPVWMRHEHLRWPSRTAPGRV